MDVTKAPTWLEGLGFRMYPVCALMARVHVCVWCVRVREHAWYARVRGRVWCVHVCDCVWHFLSTPQGTLTSGAWPE